jgi:hypothetical protein
MHFWKDHSVLRLFLLTFAISMGVWGWLEISLRMLPHADRARASIESSPNYGSLADETGVDGAAEGELLRTSVAQITR